MYITDKIVQLFMPLWNIHLTFMLKKKSLGAVMGCDHMVVGITIPVQSVPITTKVVSLNPANGEVYSIQRYLTVCQ